MVVISVLVDECKYAIVQYEFDCNDLRQSSRNLSD